MGFFTIIRSFEALLYEVMTWLVFYPRTLVSVILHPRRMIDYSDHEQGDSDEEQYTDALSPPLFLMLTILIAHGFELAVGKATPDDAKLGTLESLLYTSEETLLLMRAVMFSIYPLTFAVALIKRQDVTLDRKTLRAPFYSQCYLGALFALVISVSSTVMQFDNRIVQIGALVAMGIAVVWYQIVQTLWLKEHLPIGWLRSGLVTIGTFVKATLINLLIATIVAA